MIKVNELRVGNWISLVGDYHQVDAIENSFFQDYVHVEGNGITNEIEEIEPICLTEEILLKCKFFHNFKELKGQDFFSLQLDDEYQIYVNLNSGMFSINKQYFGTCFTLSIKYLHQLQNFYFTLAGKELEINL